MNPETRFRKSALSSAVLLALSISGAAITLNGTAYANQQVCADPTSTDSANFTMLTASGFTLGPDSGTNDVSMAWDGTAFSDSSDYTGPGGATNMTLSSTDPFFGPTWTAHSIQVFLPGSYTFDVTAGNDPVDRETGSLNVTVPDGMLGMHMLFDWGSNRNIDVFVVAAPNASFGSGVGRNTQNVVTAYGVVNNCDGSGPTPVANCLFDGKPFGSAGKPSGSQEWMLASVDGNGDGVMGIPMPQGGPFQFFNANFNMLGTFTNLQGVCATFVDTIPDAFSFTPSVTNAPQNTQFESNTITVSGLGVSPAAPDPSAVETDISITGGEYSIDGGTTWSSLPNTPRKVKNDDAIKVRGISPAVDGQTTNVALNIGGVTGVFAISTPAVATAQGSNFTMIDPSGGIVGGTNDVVASWDGTSDTNVNSIVFNRMTLSSVTPFFQFKWTAHHIRVFGPGTYQIDTTCTTDQLEAGISACNNPLEPFQQRYYNFTVGAGQIGAHMLFDWNTSTNIDVINIWDMNAQFAPSQMWTGQGACNNALQVWDLMSTDWDGDGLNGASMIDGPFGPNATSKGFNANFNLRLAGSINPLLTCSAYTPTVNVDNPSGASGCSISAEPVNALARGDWWLVAAFLAWLGTIRKRFKRQVQS